MASRLMIGTTELDAGCMEAIGTATSHAMVGETLSADQLSAVINGGDEPFIPADQEGALISSDGHAIFARFPVDGALLQRHLAAEEKVLLQTDGTTRGVYYLDSVESIGRNRYKLTAVSLIGRLITSRHYGGMYSGVLAPVLLREILDTDNFTVSDDISTATVTGYLPIATRRDNLQQVLMAIGATIQVQEDGTVNILSSSPAVTGSFDAEKCYIGGSVEVDKPVLGVQVTEHNYFPAGNVVTLFSDGVDGEELLEFSQPYHDLEITGGTIVESGVNFARISGKGTVTLTGQPYTHVTRAVTAGKVDSGTGNVKQVSRCYLANPQIAQTLADRLFDLLSHNKTIKQDVLLGPEQAGNVVRVLNPYTMQMENATIKSLDGAFSSFNKAAGEFLVGFTPSGVISGFKCHTQLTGSGSWTVPEGVSKVRAILVGGGSGGAGGSRGADGRDGSASGQTLAVGTPGNGGAAGAVGEGGKVFEISLDVAPGQVISFACGVGGGGGAGQAGAQNAEAGTPGTPTTFGVYSSDNGRVYPYGYYEAKTGQTIGASGAAGFAGGMGGTASQTQDAGGDGESVNGFAGGRGGGYRTTDIAPSGTYHYYPSGGGGAANGASGYDATAPNGADGASAGASENGVNYGQGGAGGNGGGGGGAGSVYVYTFRSGLGWQSTAGAGVGGKGGNGGTGGNGVGGCIIIYY